MIESNGVYRYNYEYALKQGWNMKPEKIIEKTKDEREEYEVLFKEIETEHRRNEAITSVVQHLQDEAPIEKVIGDICGIVGMQLNVKVVGAVKYINRTGRYITVGKYVEGEEKKWFDFIELLGNYNIELYDTIAGEKEDSDEFVSILNMSEFDTMIVRSISLPKKTDMYLVVLSDDGRKWDNRDVIFVKDVSSLISSVLDKHISENSIASSYKALKEILNNIGIGIYVIDKISREILFSNKNMVKMFGTDPTGHKCYEFPIGNDENDCKQCEFLRRSSHYREAYDADKNTWYVIKNNDITWVNGRLVSLCTVTDITDKKKYEKRIEFQANNDFLTGLYNRMRCEKDLHETIAMAVNEGKNGMVMFIDLDNFKHLNDGLGHQFGDLLLKMISIGIQQIPGIENNCYRMGGDEFVILIEPENVYRADDIIEAIEQLFKKPWYLNGTEYYCTMSMGIVCYPEDGTDVNELIKKADIAMYDAKKKGKNRVEYYNTENESSSLKRLDIEKNMRYAVSLGCNEFKVYIQPIFDMRENKCIGGEALIRWDNGNLGFLGPGDFVPLAENLGLINVIGDYFLELSCRINKAWSDMGVEAHINVNLSIVQLMQNSIVENIRKVIEKTGIKPENLVLEVTESLAINDMNRMKDILQQLKSMGVGIALDDFGTGYSSLNYIKQMSFDIIKVDKSFVDDIVEDAYSKTFVKLITELSEQLGVKVCIEGVETKAQLETIKKMNVAMIQGYYYGRPMPYREFEKKFLGLEIN